MKVGHVAEDGQLIARELPGRHCVLSVCLHSFGFRLLARFRVLKIDIPSDRTHEYSVIYTIEGMAECTQMRQVPEYP